MQKDKARGIGKLCVIGAAILAAAAMFASCARPPAAPRKLAIAAAAYLKYALDEISTQFRRTHPGVDVEPTYGSSGNFFTQISQSAPFDLFLSADMDYPRRLLNRKIGVPDSLFTYGAGRIVVWVPRGFQAGPRQGASRFLAPPPRDRQPGPCPVWARGGGSHALPGGV